MNDLFRHLSTSVRLTDAYINTRLNPTGSKTHWGALQKCYHLIRLQHLFVRDDSERKRKNMQEEK